MAKKTILVLVLAALVTGGVFAQNMFTSWAPGIVDRGTNLFINVGAGFGFVPFWTQLEIPHVEASVEYALPIGLPISVGGYFGFVTGRNKDVFISYKADLVEMAMSFGLRGSYHFNFNVRNLDTYASIALGWVIYTLNYDWKETPPDYFRNNNSDDDNSTFFYDVRVGVRYFFTNNIGAFLEAGYSPVSLVNLGLALKF
jgi:hypothetical protein